MPYMDVEGHLNPVEKRGKHWATYTADKLLTCTECFCVVPENNTDNHDRWHKNQEVRHMGFPSIGGFSV